MIKKLQKKFIILAMAVITIVIALIVSGINIVNYIKTDKEITKVISVLSENNGSMPIPSINEPDPANPQPEPQNPEEETSAEPSFDYGHRELSLETPFKTRYFTVLMGNEIKTDTSNIYTVSAEDAVNCAEYIKSKGKKTGYYLSYKYTVVESDGGTMYIFLDCEQELSFMHNLLLYSIIIGAGAVIVIFVLLIFFSKVAVKPIAESYDKQKRFITDANHEIKTPLTIIGATNEVMEMKFGTNEWSETIEEQVKRLTELTEKLVFLSRMEESGERYTMVNASVSSIASEAAEPYRMVAENQNKKFICEIETGIEGCVEASLLKRMISLLLDNAFKYSDENGEIILILEKMGKHNRLSVKNTVDEIPKGDLNYLFDRFYRLDKSRNSSTGGSGIGLSVVKAIADIFKGRITAKSEDGKSVQFDFIF